MGREEIIKRTKKIVLEAVDNILCLLILCGLMIILVFHKVGPFFPVLFLFDLCFLIGYPLFLRYVLKKKWFECTKDYYLKIKYIILPCVLMEMIVLLYYHKATLYVIKTIIESTD